MQEIEVKSKVRNPELLEQKLTALGIELSAPVEQRDKIYWPKGVAFGVSIKAPALRIRQEGAKFIFTYKIPVANNLDKIEYETGIDNPEGAAGICEQLGFEPIIGLNKVRRKAHYQNYEICIDEVEELGSYIEIERLAAEGDSEKIQQEIFEFMLTLGINPEDRVFEGYDILLFKHRNHATNKN